MKLQPVDDLVDHLALGTHREATRLSSARITARTTSRLAASCVVLNIVAEARFVRSHAR
jgi:hypothetical protein